MATSTTAERTPMTGMGATNFESQAEAASKANLRFLPSSDSIMTDESLKNQSEYEKK